jgi:hypothetical protein
MDFWARNSRQRAPCELEHCHGGESNRWVKGQAFFDAQLQITASILLIISLVNCLALRNEFKVNNALDIEESAELYLHFSFRHANFLGMSAVSVANCAICFRDRIESIIFHL